MSNQLVDPKQSRHPHWNRRLFVDPLLGALPVDIENYIESCWNHFPRDVKAVFLSCPKDGINGSSTLKNDGFIKVISFLKRSMKCHLNDKDYSWNLWQAARSAYMLAANFLLDGRVMDAMFMIFYGALMRECLARDTGYVFEYILNYTQMKFEDVPEWKGITFSLVVGKTRANMFEIFTHFANAITYTQSTMDMATFLVGFLGQFDDTNVLLQSLNYIGGRNDPTPIHSFDTFGADGLDLIRLTAIVSGSGSSMHQDLEVYPVTRIKWLFNVAFTLELETTSFLQCNEMYVVRRSIPREQCPTIEVGGGCMLYLATSGDKRVDEVGLKDGNTFVPSFKNSSASCPLSRTYMVTKPVKNQHKSKSHNDTKPVRPQSKKKPKGKKRSKTICQYHHRPQLSEGLDIEALRQAHSKRLEPVLAELHPKLKAIRDKLTAQSLQRALPKQRKQSPRVTEQDKDDLCNISLQPVKSGPKAGKTVYPILVGEASNLFKVPQLRRLKSKQRTIKLDMHGCTKAKAAKMLEQGLKKWIGLAQKGEYPFIISVDIICGGGNQVLSELVAHFIRENAQVANRPRGLA